MPRAQINQSTLTDVRVTVYQLVTTIHRQTACVIVQSVTQYCDGIILKKQEKSKKITLSIEDMITCIEIMDLFV